MDNVIQLAPRLEKPKEPSHNATSIEAIRLSLTESARKLGSSIALLNEGLGAIESTLDGSADVKSRDEFLLNLELAHLELLLEVRKASRMARNEQREI